MAGSTKILTVSYGTFSCTLEGFDDSFHSMKAIAEYFRDLAQDDRYFGAEPPSPDVEMLGRIAEREISRRVEAQMDGKGVRLRATIPKDGKPDANVSMPPKAKAPDHSDSPSSLMPAASFVLPEKEAEDQVAPTQDGSDLYAAAAPSHPDSQSIAEKLQRIRAVVGKPYVAADVAQTPPDHPEPEPEPSEAVQPKPDVTYKLAQTAAQQEPAIPAEADAPTDHSDAHDAVTHTSDDATQEDVTAAEPVRPAVRGRIVRMRKGKPAEFMDATTTPETPDADQATVVTPPADDTVDDAVAPIEADVAQVESTDIPQDDTKADEAADAFIFQTSETEDTSAQDAADAVTPPDEPHVSKPDNIRATIAAAIPAGNLTADDEDDLLRELAALNADIVTLPEDAPEAVEIIIEDPAPQETTPEAIETPQTPQRAGRYVLPETDDAAMTRIMSQTDDALNEPTGNRRRNAIAQLKAAVAATEAARQLGDTSSDAQNPQDPFREDFDQVVRPTRDLANASDQDHTAEPARSAPLKLVASQRVDEAHTAEQDVQPHRVAAQSTNETNFSDFVEFASQMGASNLADLLEAAAAYTAFVEGVEDFSRPQIMKKVQLTSDTEFSREDGLRSFGTLLRQGRISKVRNGRFQVSEQTRFRPDARSA